MKCFVLSLVLMASSAFSHHEVITSLKNGDYLGFGYYHDSDGQAGEFQSYNSIDSNEWHLSFILNTQNINYHHDMNFTFDDYGFFEVEVINHKEEEEGHNDYFYYGTGYCMSAQCHYSVDFGDKGYMEETITFHDVNNKIYRLGSHKFIDEETSLEKTLIYEEELSYVTPHETHDS